jgi:hypothetical protein
MARRRQQSQTRTSTQPESDVETVELPAEDDGGTDPGRLLSSEKVARVLIRDGEGTMSREQQPADHVVDAAWWARPSRVGGAPPEQNGEGPPRPVRISLDLAAGAGVAEDDRGTDPGRLLSSEKVASEFIREGGGAAPQKQSAEGRPARAWFPFGWATGAGVVAAVVALVLLGLLTLPDRPPTSPRASKPTEHSGKTSIPATSATSLPPTSSVTVELLNADGSDTRPVATYLRLISAGFAISSVGSAPSLIITGGQPSEIFYGPSGHAAAETLAHWLIGPVRDVQNVNLSGNNLELWIASPLLGVVLAKHNHNHSSPPLGP